MNRPPYPLQWPKEWPRMQTTSRHAPFKPATFARQRDLILWQVRKLGGRNCVVTSNMIAGSEAQPRDRGVAVYWSDSYRDVERVVACDSWNTIQSNMRAIEKSLDALRGMRRWGASSIVDRAFEGFRPALAAPGWRSVFGYRPDEPVTIREVHHRYRELAHKHHPDHGGSHETMQELAGAYAAAQLDIEQGRHS